MDLESNNESVSSDAAGPRLNSTKEWNLLEKLALGSLAEQTRARRWGIVFKLLTFAYLFVALVLFYPWDMPTLFTSSEKGHTAVVKINGMISGAEEASANAIATGLREAFKDEDTKGIVLSIDSGGGSPVQSGYVYDEIKRLRKLHEDIKVYAVIADIGASGAYYIASAADEIWAEKASLVGSIGVISADFGYVDVMKKIGIERRTFISGEHKDLLDPFQPLPEFQKKFWSETLDVIHLQFIEQVKKGRGDRLKDDPQLFSGLIWTGEKALELGLVDGLGRAGHVAREIIGAEKIVDFSVSPHPIDRLVKRLGVSMGKAIVEQLSMQTKGFHLQ